MGPEAGTGYFCASTSVKPRAVARERARERNTERSGREREIELREKEIEGWTIPVFLIARYPPGIFIIRDLVRKNIAPNSHESYTSAQHISAIRNPPVHNFIIDLAI